MTGERCHASRSSDGACHDARIDRKLVSIVLAVAVAAAGSLAAHVMAYLLVAPGAAERQHLLEGTGHGYMQHQSDLFAVLIAVASVALFAVVALSRRGSRLSAPPSWPFALMPLLGFPVQEHAERWLHTGAFPQDAASSRLFVLGLVLQLPFALVGWLAARWLFAVARSVGLALADQPFAIAPVVASIARPRGADRPQPLGALLGGLGSRAPPCCS